MNKNGIDIVYSCSEEKTNEFYSDEAIIKQNINGDKELFWYENSQVKIDSTIPKLLLLLILVALILFFLIIFLFWKLIFSFQYVGSR